MLPGRSIQAPDTGTPDSDPGFARERYRIRISSSGGFALREPQPSPPRKRGSDFGFPGNLGRSGLPCTVCGSIADHRWAPAFAGATKRATGMAKEAPEVPLAFAAASGPVPERRSPA